MEQTRAIPRGLPTRKTYALPLRAFFAFVLLGVGFRILGFHRVLKLILRRYTNPAGWLPAEGKRQAEHTFRAVQKATMFYYRRSEDCLPKAFTTFHLLRRQGIPAELCFGVRKFSFGAHSWVEAYGAPLDDDPARLRTYTVIYRVGT